MIETVKTQATRLVAKSGDENTCGHQFERHVGIKVFNRTGMAWIQLSLVAGADDAPEMWICIHCGEEGFEVPA